MINLLEKIYCKYNHFETTDNFIMYDKTALRILKENTSDLKNLNKRIRTYDSEEIKNMNVNHQELVYGINMEQPRCNMLTILYIEIILNNLPEIFFEEIGIHKNRLLQIVLSIFLSYTFLQTYYVTNKPLNRTEESKRSLTECLMQH